MKVYGRGCGNKVIPGLDIVSGCGGSAINPFCDNSTATENNKWCL